MLLKSYTPLIEYNKSQLYLNIEDAYYSLISFTETELILGQIADSVNGNKQEYVKVIKVDDIFEIDVYIDTYNNLIIYLEESPLDYNI